MLQFHLRDAATSAEDLRNVLERYHGESAGAPAGGLMFSCLGRGEGLYGVPSHDTRLLEECLGSVPLGGFFCNGEIGPVQGRTYLHGYNQLLRPVSSRGRELKEIALVTTSYPDRVVESGQEAAGAFVADFARALSQHARVRVVAAAGEDHVEQLDQLTVHRFRGAGAATVAAARDQSSRLVEDRRLAECRPTRSGARRGRS